jgi:hypothetical protein
VIDAEIATVSGAADKVLHVRADSPYLIHLEFVSGHDAAALPQKLIVRNAALENRHDLPVPSVAILLRPEADSARLSGVYERGFAGEPPYLVFRYQVIRVWKMPPDSFLTGGLPLVALAPICDVTESQLPGIIKKMELRLGKRESRRHSSAIWSAAYILLGLRYSPFVARQLFRSVLSMRESSTYQEILEEGRTEGRSEGRNEGRNEGAVMEARRILRLQADDAFGPPAPRIAEAIESIDDLKVLEKVLSKIRSTSSWEELLDMKKDDRRRGRKRRL